MNQFVRASVVGFVVSTLVIMVGVRWCRATCPGNGIGNDPNVAWVSLPDSVAACPAGDSVVAGHPSRVRGVLLYGDQCHIPKQGVPPESLWIKAIRVSGNLVINDEIPNKIYADDSTDANGYARFQNSEHLRVRASSNYPVRLWDRLRCSHNYDQDHRQP